MPKPNGVVKLKDAQVDRLRHLLAVRKAADHDLSVAVSMLAPADTKENAVFDIDLDAKTLKFVEA